MGDFSPFGRVSPIASARPMTQSPLFIEPKSYASPQEHRWAGAVIASYFPPGGIVHPCASMTTNPCLGSPQVCLNSALFRMRCSSVRRQKRLTGPPTPAVAQFGLPWLGVRCGPCAAQTRPSIDDRFVQRGGFRGCSGGPNWPRRKGDFPSTEWPSRRSRPRPTTPVCPDGPGEVVFR
jgi:hypothetical protein